MTDAKTLLLARRAELTGDIARIEDQLDDPVSKDWEEAASDRQGDEVLHSLSAHDQTEIRGIDAALKRIEDGSYGTCGKCGNAISAERLEVVPTAALCRTCAT